MISSRLKDANPIEIGTNGISSIQNNLKLLLAKVNRTDEGIFSCVVQNAAGETRADFQLTVLTAPRILVLDNEKNK